MLVSCEDEIHQSLPGKTGTPITFVSTEEEEQILTRASNPLNRNFVVWGYKSFVNPDATQKVFQGYTVVYGDGTAGSSNDNTDGYSYVNGIDQDIKYWDFAASEYNFWGYTGDKNCFSADGKTLIISHLQQSVTEPDVSGQMFSALNHREKPFKDVVRLQFKRPYAKVRVMFYCSEAIDEGDAVEIGESTFGPEPTNQFVTDGTLKVTYPTSGNGPETYETESPTYGDNLSFESVNLSHTVGISSNKAALAKPVDGTECYYVIPYEYNKAFTLSTTVDDDLKTARVPAELMHWLPNYTYTYLFKITEAGKKIEFYDVQIDPWHYGGSQEDEWKNW